MNSLIGVKLGMTRIFDEVGRDLPVTIINAGPCTVSQVKTVDVDGYNAVQLAFGSRKEKNMTKPVLGHLAKAGISSASTMKEFRTDDVELNTGDVLTVEIFAPGDVVKVTGKTIGKGFTGVMKRHGFHGGRASHGKNDQLRAGGSIGASSDPSRVIPGVRMPGRSGNATHTTKNLLIVKVVPETNQIFIRGAIPGPKNGTVTITKLS